jgi:hypothetical protein
MPSRRRRTIGLAGAAIWLAAGGSAFLIPGLWRIGTANARVLSIAAAVVASVLVAKGVAAIRSVLRLPGTLPPRSESERAAYRRFWRVFAIEIVAIAMAVGFCMIFRQFRLIVPVSVMIVGVHFLPLARIFQVFRYYALGVLFCAGGVLPLLFFPPQARIGQAFAWFVVPALVCAPTAWITAIANLREANRSIRSESSAEATAG